MTDDFDPNWPHGHVTRKHGYPSRIYATDGAEPFPIHGAMKRNTGWCPFDRRCNGRGEVERLNPYDIINAPAPVVREVRWLEFSIYGYGEKFGQTRHNLGTAYPQHLRLTFENDRCVEAEIFDKDQEE